VISEAFQRNVFKAWYAQRYALVLRPLRAACHVSVHGAAHLLHAAGEDAAMRKTPVL